MFDFSCVTVPVPKKYSLKMSSYSLLGKDRNDDSEKSLDENESVESFEMPVDVRLNRKRGFFSSLCSSRGTWAFHLAFMMFNVGMFVLVSQRIRPATDFSVDGAFTTPRRYNRK